MKDLTNLQVGELTVTSFSHKKPKKENGKYDYFWNCKCSCGKELVVNASNLFRKFNTKSCGCQRRFGLWKGVGDISGSYFASIKHNAKKRNLPFRISLKEVWELFEKQHGKCALSGVPLVFARKYARGDEQTASLDRIDETKGYVKGNLMWVHKEVNGMRLTISLDKFRGWCKLIAAYENIV